MKLMFVSDLQIHQYKRYPETDDNGVNLRLLDVVNELGRLRRLCTKNGVRAFFVLGDVFEARNAIEVPVMNALWKAMYDFADHGIRPVLLVGNHDRTDVGAEHALEVFKPFCTVVDAPTTLRMQGMEILAIPFHPNPKAVARAIARGVTTTTSMLLLHTGIRTLTLPNGKVWGEGITLDSIPTHVTCLIGHYHKWTELRSGKVYYLGSMLQVDKSDASFSKYFAVYDSEKEERQQLRFYETQGPKFIAVDIEFVPDSTDMQFPLHTRQEFEEKYGPLVLGNFVTVNSVPTNCTSLGDVETLLRGIGARHVEFGVRAQAVFAPPQLETGAYSTPIDVVTDVLESFVESAETSLDKEALIEEGKDVLQTVESPTTPSDNDINTHEYDDIVVI